MTAIKEAVERLADASRILKSGFAAEDIVSASDISLVLAELDKHKEFMKSYYKWALSPDGTGGGLFDDMVEAAEKLPPEGGE